MTKLIRTFPPIYLILWLIKSIKGRRKVKPKSDWFKQRAHMNRLYNSKPKSKPPKIKSKRVDVWRVRGKVGGEVKSFEVKGKPKKYKELDFGEQEEYRVEWEPLEDSGYIETPAKKYKNRRDLS